MNDFSLTIWPRFVKFVKLSRYMVFKQMNIKLESDEGELCAESSLIWNQLITSSCFELCDVQRFHYQKVYAIEGAVLYPYKNEEICLVLFHIRIFAVFALQFALLQYVAHKCTGHMYVTMTSELLSGSSRSTRLTHFQLWIWHTFWHENLWGYQDYFIYKNGLLL